MRNFDLSLDNDILKKFKQVVDVALQQAVRRMIAKDAKEGTVTMKIGIGFPLDAEVDPETGELVRSPIFEGKVSINIPEKIDADIPMIGGSRLVRMGEGYKLIDPQISMDEIMEEKEEP